MQPLVKPKTRVNIAQSGSEVADAVETGLTGHARSQAKRLSLNGGSDESARSTKALRAPPVAAAALCNLTAQQQTRPTDPGATEQFAAKSHMAAACTTAGPNRTGKPQTQPFGEAWASWIAALVVPARLWMSQQNALVLDREPSCR